MSREFNDFLQEFTEEVTAEYRRLARGTPKNNRFLLGKIQRRAMEVVAKHYFSREHSRKITV